MSVQVQHRRDSKANIDTVTPAVGEIGMETTRKKIRFGDGTTLGGIRVARDNWRDSAGFTLSANTNDWAPAAFEELGLLIITTTGAFNLTGLAGGAVGRDIEIRLDPAAAGSITIKHQNTSSSAVNRFNCPSGNDIILTPGSVVIGSYDAANSRWLMRGMKAASVSVTPAGVQQDGDTQAVLNTIVNRLVKVIARSTTAPPGSPANNDSYIVPTGATGAWNAQTNNLATWSAAATAWVFTAPVAEQYVVSVEDQCLLRYSGSAWVLPKINFYLSNELSPAQISADAINYNPAGFYAANVIRFSVDQNNRKLTGFAGGDAGQYKVFENIGTTNALFTHEDTASTAANRMTIGKNLLVRPNESITFRYDITTSRWLMVARSVVTFNEIQGDIYFNGIITPALAADQNDWSPTGFSTCNTIYFTPSVNVNITGFAGGAEGREITLFNTTAFTVTLKEQSNSSTAVNRFAFGGDLSIAANQSATLRYSGVASRWLVMVGPSLIALSSQVAANVAATAAITAGSTAGVNDTLVNVQNTVTAAAAGLAIALG